MGKALDPIETFDALKDAYFRYYDTPFGLADSTIQDERRRILDADGASYREPLIEIRPEYTSAETEIHGSCARAGADADLAEFASRGLLAGVDSLYGHQELALSSGVASGRNMVITAGTGSGKTESFLLPLLSSLLAESRSWTGSTANYNRWWAEGEKAYVPQRAQHHGRPAAVRAMILYPMNALVEDQLVRLRKALDSDAVRTWLDEHRNGERFYFGRYTGATPVSGAPSNKSALKDLRNYLRATEERWKRADAAAAAEGNDDLRYFVPRLDGAEVVSRWDMLDVPPDILLTNYSMLNVMLMRERDDNFFDSTRDWLKNEDNVFTLILDELHTYRGTSGTEVAYLIRNLKRRLGLESRPNQFRVLAASASLDPVRDSKYVHSFFDVKEGSFDFIKGTEPPIPDAKDHSADLPVLLRTEASDLLISGRNLGILDSMEGVLRQEGPLTVGQLGTRLFPAAASGAEVETVCRRLLAQLSSNGHPSDPKLRVHMFFRNVTGVWACTDPDCSEVVERSQSRRVGRLYREPMARCQCGARVLELLYCQTCGDAMLGGFAPKGDLGLQATNTRLSCDAPDLSLAPDRQSVERAASNYLVYWPRPVGELENCERLEWTRDNKAFKFAFRKSVWNPQSGVLKNKESGFSGWTFHVQESNASKLRRGYSLLDRISPFPAQCPACGDDWGQSRDHTGRVVKATDPQGQRSPVRLMRTGFEKINQVLTSELATLLPQDERKLIVFTDSRQDAAKLAAGLSLRHYQDLLRQVLYREIAHAQSAGSEDFALVRKLVLAPRRPGNYSDEFLVAARQAQGRLKVKHEWLAEQLLEVSQMITIDEVNGKLDSIEARIAAHPTLSELVRRVGKKLLSMGVNPGGPYASLQRTKGKRGEPGKPWSHLYTWDDPNNVVRRPSLSEAESSLIEKIDEKLHSEVLTGLFSGGGRDFESIGLGWLALSTDTAPAGDPGDWKVAEARSALKVLADQRNFSGLRMGRDDVPSRLKNLWNKIDCNVDPIAKMDSLRAIFGPALVDYLINPEFVVLRPPEGRAWICEMCSKHHLSVGIGRCTRCAARLPESSVQCEKFDDYYAWKASREEGQFRLNATELTGQTDRIDAQARQARFQDVFLEGAERPEVDGIDLLSVTTTMEAGVDIGALSVVVMGNMPPTRFNYQQRVGRAGRRKSPVAIALTVCRGRSHDEYYFDKPQAITNDPTPPPYLALDRPQILIRTARAEVLRRAFREQLGGTDIEKSSNTHGAFGLVADWADTLRPLIVGWLAERSEEVADVVRSLMGSTDLDLDVPQLCAEVQEGLVEDIDTALSSARHADVSQALAEAGILPMFGFPTSVRHLYLWRPQKSFPWPPNGTVDRDLAMAVSSFAPMSEIVKDGKVYPVIGVAGFTPAGGGSPAAHEDALGPETPLAVCSSCSHIERSEPWGPDSEERWCPQCGAGGGDYRFVSLREPTGFRAYRGQDFDGNFAWTPRSMSSRATANLSELNHVESGSLVAYSGPGARYVINDNSGNMYRFAEVGENSSPHNWGGYVAQQAVDNGWVSKSELTGESLNVALGTVQTTDFLFVGPRRGTDASHGLRVDLSSDIRQPHGATEPTTSRRAAWYSLAFLLRKMASVCLDIQPQELVAGLYSGSADGQPVPRVFLADALENGAGFSTYLGQTDVIDDFLDQVELNLRELSLPEHADFCDGSCYQCLRDYGNMAFHGLLDWRLARDLFLWTRRGLFRPDRGRDFSVLSTWLQANRGEMLNCSVPSAIVEAGRDGRFGIIVKHAFEAAERPSSAGELPLIASRLAAAQAHLLEADSDLDGVIFVDSFALSRNPLTVDNLMNQVRDLAR